MVQPESVSPSLVSSAAARDSLGFSRGSEKPCPATLMEAGLVLRRVRPWGREGSLVGFASRLRSTHHSKPSLLRLVIFPE